MRLAAALLAGLTTLPLWAATIEVRVRDELGAVVPHVKVQTFPVTSSCEAKSKLSRTAATDRMGLATLRDVSPGRHRLSIPPTAGYVFPADNPFTRKREITVREPEEILQLEMELWRGVQVTGDIVFDDQGTDAAQVLFRELDLGTQIEARFRPPSFFTRRLVPGRWEVTLLPLEGYLLRGIDVGRRSVDNYPVRLVLTPEHPPVSIAWYLKAPAVLYGGIEFLDGLFPVTIAAELVQAGPWLEEVRRRKGPSYRTVTTEVDLRNHSYILRLPDGHWKVRATCARCDAIPGEVSVKLSPGDRRSVNFSVVRQPTVAAQKTVCLRVSTKSSGGPECGATFEIWPRQAAALGQPLASKKALPGQSAVRFCSLGPGDYTVVAAHPDFMEGIYESVRHGSRNTNVGVRLNDAASLYAVVSGPGRKPVENVRLTLTRVDEIPEHWIADPEIVGRILRPDGQTDAAGRASIRGIWPGRYRLSPKLIGLGSRGGVARFFRDGELHETLELEFVAGEEIVQDLVVVSSAAFGGRLVCTDGRPVPGLVSIRVLPIKADPGDEDASISLTGVPLVGNHRDRFLIGPVKNEAYEIAFRPKGHDRWTWPMGTERHSEFTAIQGRDNELVELGDVMVDCGTKVRLVPRVLSRRPVPDLRQVTPHAGRLEIRGTVRDPDGRTLRVRHATVEASATEIVLRDIPEGQAELEIVLRHPYFLPAEVIVSFKATLERGRTISVPASIADVAGALEVFTGVEPAVRLTMEPDIVRVEPTVAGRAFVENLPAGSYRVELCRQATCDEVVWSWDAIRVEPLKTTTIRPE